MTALPAAAHPEILLQIEGVTRQIAADPGNAQLYLKRGDLFRDHEDWPKALADFQRARELDAGLRFLDFSEGRVRVDSGHAEDALPFLNRFLEKESDNAEGLAVLGRATTP